MRCHEWSFPCEDSINKFLLFFIYYSIFVVSLEWEVLAFAQRQPDKAAQPLSGCSDSDAMADLIPCDQQMSRRVDGRLVLAPEKSREAFLIRVAPVLSMAAVSGLCYQLNKQRSLEDNQSHRRNRCIGLQDAICSCNPMLKKVNQSIIKKILRFRLDSGRL